MHTYTLKVTRYLGHFLYLTTASRLVCDALFHIKLKRKGKLISSSLKFGKVITLLGAIENSKKQGQKFCP